MHADSADDANERRNAGSTKDSGSSIHRVGAEGYLHHKVPVFDEAGVVIEHVLRPLMVELRARDVIQILVGSSILAIPVAFTQETWDLGASLPAANIIGLVLVSLVFIALFVHYNFYKGYLRQYVISYVLRVAVIYAVSLVVVGGLMTLIGQCPWTTDWMLAVKRIVIVGLPASMSASVTDALK